MIAARFHFTALSLLIAVHAARVHAQSGDAAVADELIAPALLHAEPARYPAGETATVTVELELAIDVAGKVTSANVTQSAGPAFDQAALEAAPRLTFSPALRNGTPIPAVIPFRFELAPPVEAEAENLNRQGAADAKEERESDSQSELGVLRRLGGSNSSSSSSDPPLAEANLTVRGLPPLREPTRHSLELEEVRTVPGTGGDVLRAVETMPGVARPAWGEGLLIVRGAAPDDSLVFIDGTPIPYAYHLGDGNSVIPGDVLERLDFYPGNFGPQFGRGMGGVIDAGLRAPRRDRLHALAQLDVVDGRALVEGPIGEHSGFLLAARRSWVDAWIGSVLNGTGTELTSAPVYWDGQAILEHDFSPRTRGRLSFFGADDRFELLIKAPSASDPALSGALGGFTRFLRTQAQLSSELSDTVSWTNTLSWGATDSSQSVGSNFFDWRAHDFAARSDLRAGLAEPITLLAGLDAVASYNDVDARFRPYPEDGAASGPYFARPPRSLQATASLLRPGAYVGLELSPVPSVKLLPSVRSDYAHDTRDVSFDPRFSARWDVVTSPRRTTLKGGIGLFHQPPKIEHTADAVGTEGVSSSRALHASLGVEQELAGALELSLEAFYKRLEDLIVARADESRLIGARFENAGDGRIYGAETLLRYKPPRGWLSGYLAYTLSRSERRDDGAGEFETFEWDQTHIFSLVTTVQLGRGWSFGARFRYVTGTPFTPNVGGLLDLDAGAYAPIAASERNGERMPDFHQLDLRIEKQWDFELWKLAAYLEARNAYNHRSVEGVTYNYDYSERKNVEGLPILPVLGLRGEL